MRGLSGTIRPDNNTSFKKAVVAMTDAAAQCSALGSSLRCFNDASLLKDRSVWELRPRSEDESSTGHSPIFDEQNIFILRTGFGEIPCACPVGPLKRHYRAWEWEHVEFWPSV